MTTTTTIPAIDETLEGTRSTLHAYARAIAAVPRAHGVEHPHWWHTSLKVRPEGLVTDPVPLPDGGLLGIGMHMRAHIIEVRSSTGERWNLDLRAGMTGAEMGDAIVAVAEGVGLEGGYDRERYDDAAPREYDPEAAERFGSAFTTIAVAFERHRVTLDPRVSPVQVWPHGFDLAFDWFGTGTADHDGETLPAQLNLGFYPGAEPYFYSNPWPFDESLTSVALPHGATWNVDGWQGTKLPYDVVRETDDPVGTIVDYARAVYEAAAPTLS